MLAGRKLLLADDSITIQKIVALTFADEGIEVVAVSDGAEAVAKLEEISPDIVLADVFMPSLSGYQVCEHIKQTERLKHIKVMLLVGSFEPLDEVEARRVGADDILTKPFQSIRNLVDKVGALLGRPAAVEQLDNTLSDEPQVAPIASLAAPPVTVAPPMTVAKEAAEEIWIGSAEESPSVADAKEAGTQELPPPELVLPPEEPMTSEEMEITTADTQPLSPEILRRAQQSTLPAGRVIETVLETETMQTNLDSQPGHDTADSFGDALLDLDAFESVGFGSDDVMLDVDFESPAPEMLAAPWGNGQRGVAVAVPVFPHVFVTEKPELKTPADRQTNKLVALGNAPEDAVAPVASGETVSAAWDPQAHVHQPEYLSTEPAAPSGLDAGVATPAGQIKLEQLSPEVVDAIARRVVEQLSEKAVQEIAWEVVPQLADLMIRRKLEEREAQNK